MLIFMQIKHLSVSNIKYKISSMCSICWSFVSIDITYFDIIWDHLSVLLLLGQRWLILQFGPYSWSLYLNRTHINKTQNHFTGFLFKLDFVFAYYKKNLWITRTFALLFCRCSQYCLVLQLKKSSFTKKKLFQSRPIRKVLFYFERKINVYVKTV